MNVPKEIISIFSISIYGLLSISNHVPTSKCFIKMLVEYHFRIEPNCGVTSQFVIGSMVLFVFQVLLRAIRSLQIDNLN